MKNLVLLCSACGWGWPERANFDLGALERGEETKIDFPKSCNTPQKRIHFRFKATFSLNHYPVGPQYIGLLSDGRDAVLTIGRKHQYLYTSPKPRRANQN